jgi:hypothetical protein
MELGVDRLDILNELPVCISALHYVRLLKVFSLAAEADHRHESENH